MNRNNGKKTKKGSLALPIGIAALAVIAAILIGTALFSGGEPLRFMNASLVLSESEPVLLRLADAGNAKNVRYSVEGDALVITQSGADGVTVQPLKDGEATVTATDKKGRKGTCDVTVVLYRDILDLISSGDVTVNPSCGSVQSGTLTVTNNTDRVIAFFVGPGTYMKAKESGYQDMMIMTALKNVVEPHREYSWKVDVSGMNFDRAIPDKRDKFTLERIDGGPLRDMAEYCMANEIPYDVRQAAMWILTDNVSYMDCMTLRDSDLVSVVSEEDYREAQRLLTVIRSGTGNAEKTGG